MLNAQFWSIHLSPEGRKIITEFGVSKFGQQLFFPEQDAAGSK